MSVIKIPPLFDDDSLYRFFFALKKKKGKFIQWCRVKTKKNVETTLSVAEFSSWIYLIDCAEEENTCVSMFSDIKIPFLILRPMPNSSEWARKTLNMFSTMSRTFPRHFLQHGNHPKIPLTRFMQFSITIWCPIEILSTFLSLLTNKRSDTLPPGQLLLVIFQSWAKSLRHCGEMGPSNPNKWPSCFSDCSIFIQGWWRRNGQIRPWSILQEPEKEIFRNLR